MLITLLAIRLQTPLLRRRYCPRTNFRIERWLRARSCQNVPTWSCQEVSYRLSDSQAKTLDCQLLDGQRERTTNWRMDWCLWLNQDRTIHRWCCYSSLRAWYRRQDWRSSWSVHPRLSLVWSPCTLCTVSQAIQGRRKSHRHVGTSCSPSKEIHRK